MSIREIVKEEEGKIAALQKELDVRKKRLAAVIALFQEDGIKSVKSKAKASGVTKVKGTRTRVDAGKLTPEAFKILQFIGSEGHTMPEILAFCESIGYKTNAVNMRGMIRYWSGRHEWLDSPRHGVHRLTSKGSHRLTQPLVPTEAAK